MGTSARRRKPATASKKVAIEPTSPEFKVGDRVYFEKNDRRVYKILEIVEEAAKLDSVDMSGSSFLAALTKLKRWEFKYCPGQWVKVKHSAYPKFIRAVNHFKTEPDDGLKYYRVMLAPWLDKETDAETIAQSDIEYEVLEPAWVNLDDGDRVARNDERTPGAYISGALIDAYSSADSLEVEVCWDNGETNKIQLQELLPFDLPWRVGDRVTEDINTENAYKEGWASERNRTHGTIVYFTKSGNKFCPHIRKADGSISIANPQSLQPYAGNEPLPEPEPSEPPITAEQVVEEMDRAMQQVDEPALPTPEEIEAAIVVRNQKQTVLNLLQCLGFVAVDWLEMYRDTEPQDYRGWQIVTESSEGALMAVCICYQRQWYTLPTQIDCWDFGYSGHEQAIDWAKQFINCLIDAADKASGQLSLLDTSPQPGAPEEPETAIAPTTQPSLDSLIDEISDLYGKLEEAEEVSVSAAKSAFEFARDMGQRLLEAKQLAGHGNWEPVRDRIVSPRTGKALPSSTATLYQRIASRWQELEQNGVSTIREAAGLLKSDRKSATPAQNVADLPSAPIESDRDLTQRLESLQQNFSDRRTQAEAVETKYRLVEDRALPQLEELMTLYRAVGVVTPATNGKGFSVERPDLGPPFPLAFKTREAAWDYWQRKKDKLLLMAERKPMSEELVKPSETIVWQTGDILTNAEGDRLAVVAQVEPGGALVVTWENNQQQTLTQKQIQEFGYRKRELLVGAALTGYDSTTGNPRFNLMPLPDQPTQEEVDEANWGHLKDCKIHDDFYSDTLRAELELAEEYLEDEFKEVKAQTQQVIYKLGATAVAMMAIEESDYDSLLELREFLNKTIEEVEDDR